MQSTAPITAVPQRASNSPRSPRQIRRGPLNPMHHLDQLIDSVIGADMRLIYGMAVPMLLVCGVILALVTSPSYWLVAAAIVAELCCLSLIVTKLMAMLGETDDEQPSDRGV